MSDEQIWNLVVTVGFIAITVIGSVAFAAWWLKSQLVGSEIKGLKAENQSLRAQVGNVRSELGVVSASRDVLEQRRLLAEEQRKKSEHELLNVKAQLDIARERRRDKAPAESISQAINIAATSTASALISNNATGTLLTGMFRLPPSDATPQADVQLFVEKKGA